MIGHLRALGAGAALAVCLAAGGGAAQASTNLITDGDFSTPNTAGGWNLFPNGSVGDWQDGINQIEVGNSFNIYGLPCDNAGCQNLEVNVFGFDTVSQLVTGLVAGHTYELSWDYGGRPGGGPQQLDASFGANSLTIDSGSLGAWTHNSFVVTADGSSDLLQFAASDVGGLPGWGNEITNVSLTALPEPATWAMMLFGVGLIGAGLRLTRRNALALAA